MAAMLAIGYRALQYSADEAMEDAEGASAEAKDAGERAKSGGWAMAGAMAMALLLGVGLFFLIPLYATHLMAGLVPALRGSIAFNLADGAIRVLVFVLYIVGITADEGHPEGLRVPRRGAQVINAYEAKADLSPEAVREYPRLHPRCGTSFLLFVMVISILVFSLIPRESSLLAKALLRLPLIPAIAGISYEVLRLSAKKTRSPWFRGARRSGAVAAAADHPGAGPAPDRGCDRVVPARVGAAGGGGLPCGISSNRLWRGYRSSSGCCRTRRSRRTRGRCSGSGGSSPTAPGGGRPTRGTGRSSRSSPTTVPSRTERPTPR